MANASLTLGQILRTARERAGLSLRDLGHRVSKTASYLSDIENDRRVPAEQLMHDLAEQLDLDGVALMALGGRMSADAELYMKRHPRLSGLLHRIIEKDATDEELDSLISALDRLVESRRGRKTHR